MCHYASNKNFIVSASKCTKNRLAAGLRQHPLGELTVLPKIPQLDLGDEKKGKRGTACGGDGREENKGRKGRGGKRRSPPQ